MLLLSVAALVAALLCACSAAPAQTARAPLSRRIPNNGEIVRAIRGALRGHTREITVRFDCGEELLDELTALTGEWVEEALAETERPDEGDYIRLQYGGYQSSSAYTFSDGVYHYQVRIVPRYYCYLVQEEAVTQRLAEVMADFGFDAETPDEEKLRTIYDYVCSTVRYDRVHADHPTATLRSTAYSALIWHSATCQGYSVLLYRMLRTAGLDCRVVTGTASGPNGEEFHAWNLVRLGERWYALDATWDAGREEYLFFLKGREDFRDHVPAPFYESEAFRADCPMAERDWEEGAKKPASNP